MAYPVMPLGFLGSQGDNDNYRIERSLRFNSADGAYLTYTPAVDGNRYTWTWSGWIKRTNIGSAINYILYGTGAAATAFVFTANDNLYLYNLAGIVYPVTLLTNQVFRDTSSWYHIVLVYDANNATASNRQRIYVNGQRITSFSTEAYTTDPAYGINRASYPMTLGVAGGYFDGYMAEVNFIDGQALTPSSFGETDAITGRWKAKPYSGTYGTNGSYLKFADNSGTTATTLGKDSSGNGKNWTPTNFSVTAGAGNDSLVDSPTNYGADSYNITVDNSRGNYNTFNPLSKVTTATLTNGNLDAGASGIAIGSIGITSGKWYWEVTSTGGATAVGLYSASATSTRSVAIGVTEGFRFDASAGTLDYTTNGSTFTSIATGLTSTPYFIYVSTAAATTASLNCGQRLFSYTMPSGYKALCTTNLTTPIIKKPDSYFDALIYTGTGASNSISSLGFSPDLVWIKNRGGATSHAIYDTTRGTQSQLSSDTTGDQATSSSGLTAFGSNGFTIGTSTLVNTSGTQYVAWGWDEAPIAGMDIVSYTGTGSATTWNHNLGVAPKMMIVKATSRSGDNWDVYHSSIGATGRLFLELTNSVDTSSAPWNNTSPTSSVFTVGIGQNVNATGVSYIAYLFSEVEGFSKFGSYTGNGSADGPFVYCGFRPRFVLIKRTDSTSEWFIWDTARSTFNEMTTYLSARSSNAESTFSGVVIDCVSNGLKLRGSYAEQNAYGGTYIFAAFAEAPFKYARAR